MTLRPRIAYCSGSALLVASIRVYVFPSVDHFELFVVVQIVQTRRQPVIGGSSGPPSPAHREEEDDAAVARAATGTGVRSAIRVKSTAAVQKVRPLTS